MKQRIIDSEINHIRHKVIIQTSFIKVPNCTHIFLLYLLISWKYIDYFNHVVSLMWLDQGNMIRHLFAKSARNAGYDNILTTNISHVFVH